MASYFQRFSEVVVEVNPAEREWIKNVLTSQDNQNEQDGDVMKKLNSLGIRARNVNTEYWPGFDWQMEDGGTDLWMYSEESGDLQNLAEFVRAFLARFRPESSWRLTWADTCSKPRIGEFSGGGLFVTAKRIRFFHATDAVRRAENRFKKATRFNRSIAPPA